MPTESKIRDKIVTYINNNPRPEGYMPSFFVDMFTTDVHYCRHLLLELAEKGQVIKRNYTGKNHKQAYRFYSNGQRNQFIINKRIHYLMGEASKLVRKGI